VSKNTDFSDITDDELISASQLVEQLRCDVDFRRGYKSNCKLGTVTYICEVLERWIDVGYLHCWGQTVRCTVRPIDETGCHLLRVSRYQWFTWKS